MRVCTCCKCPEVLPTSTEGDKLCAERMFGAIEVPDDTSVQPGGNHDRGFINPTILLRAGLVCLFLRGSPSECSWLTPEGKTIIGCYPICEQQAA